MERYNRRLNNDTVHQHRQAVLDWPNIFDAAVERLLNSPNPVERNSIFAGLAADGGYPLLVPTDVLLRHGLFLGDPGSNKTAKGLAPIAAQLIASGKNSVSVLDLKGDLALFHGVRIEAERAGLPFKVFTNQAGWESNIFNPLNQTYIKKTSRAQQAQHMIAALGMDYGDMYGAAYFSSRMELYLTNLLYAYGHSISSMADLYRFCSDPAAYKRLGPGTDWEQSRHLHAQVGRMATMLELNGSPRTLPNNQLALDNQIQCEEFLTTPMVVYFLLKSPVGPATQRSIGRLWLYGQLQAAALLPPDRDVPAFNIMDEAQQLVSALLPIILAMARSHKIGCLLAHQSLDQLKLGDLDLTQIMLSTTAYKQIFRASDLIVRDYLTKTGGEALYHDLNWGQEVSFRNGEPDERKLSPLNAWRDATGKTPSFRVSERVGPALDSNSIMDNMLIRISLW